ncbi:MAG: hypothetical protein KME12_06725 [Trichocoleus desertorum ATA4-8-CV12]|jgi:hypothetical protein|nr:hypothetical protein [Trichocoleus desertorum ATA4-8-CV12]
MTSQQSMSTNQLIPPIAPINSKAIVENGNSPTAIILAIAILIAVLLGSITGLVRVLVLVMLQRSQSSQ